MIAVQTPWVLWLSGLAALGVVLAHLLSVGRPPELALPTTRFVPEGPLDAVSQARALRDLLLLCLRLLAVLLAGAAFAGLRIAPTRAPLATLLVLDLPRYAIDTLAWRDSVRAQLETRAPVLAMVTSDGRTIDGEVAALRAFADTVALVVDGASHSSLAGGLLVARRAARAVAPRADSMSLVVVSSFRDDAATPALREARAMWPGRVALASVPVGQMPVGAMPVDTLSAANVRTVVGAPSADDSSFARAGGVLVVWPDGTRQSTAPRTDVDSADADSAYADSAYAVVARGVALVTPLLRAAAVPAHATPTAWWPDGTPAIGDSPIGLGCQRSIGFTTPMGDALLTRSARGVRAVLEAACTASVPPVLPDSLRALLVGDGAMASRSALAADADDTASSLARWLLLAAIAALLIEQGVRSREPRCLT
jgi:hypothetical protein